MIFLNADKVKELVANGGCPANNIKCKAIINGKCCMKDPELSQDNGKVACGSYIWEEDDIHFIATGKVPCDGDCI